ncbi:MAG: hypothetical protein HC770_03540 [Pseudanabaena sp. CRU_2_10]|nr:hypothetical protein [Pseudanabaena sp. CRU_2_10]
MRLLPTTILSQNSKKPAIAAKQDEFSRLADGANPKLHLEQADLRKNAMTGN